MFPLDALISIRESAARVPTCAERTLGGGVPAPPADLHGEGEEYEGAGPEMRHAADAARKGP
jgi:hypothetical protein